MSSSINAPMSPPSPAPEPPKNVAPSKSRWWMWLLVPFSLVGGCTTCSTGCLVYAASKASSSVDEKPALPSEMILVADLRVDYPEMGASDPFTESRGGSPSLLDVIQAIDAASTDPRVKVLLVRADEVAAPLASVQELRAAILRFNEQGKATGKKSIAFADTFGEGVSGTKAYYLASACQEIWVQPSGDVGLAGLAAEVPFVRGFFEQIGVEPQFAQRKEYKNAVNTFTEKDWTPGHKEAMEALLASYLLQISEGIAKERKIDVEAVKTVIREGPYSSEEALNKKLIDKRGYRDELLAALQKDLGSDVSRIRLGSYIDDITEQKDGLSALEESMSSELTETDNTQPKEPGIALVYATGDVVRGSSKRDAFGFGGDPQMAADDVSLSIREATKDDSIKAIVLRVDSPGGSYVAADTIWREVKWAKEQGKKIIVSMGDVAASGGYFVAMPADTIFASPATITGSIGVYTGKMSMAGLFEKIGVRMGTVATSPNGLANSGTQPWTVEDRAKVDASLDRIYSDFVGKAAQGRNMSFDALEPLARGRIWSGLDAKEKKLVDELGGLVDAVAYAKKSVQLGEDAPVRIFPKVRPWWEEIVKSFEDESSEEEETTRMQQAGDEVFWGAEAGAGVKNQQAASWFHILWNLWQQAQAPAASSKQITAEIPNIQ